MIYIYSTETCPKNKIVENALENKNMVFTTVYNKSDWDTLDICDIPAIKIKDGCFLTYREFMSWI